MSPSNIPLASRFTGRFARTALVVAVVAVGGFPAMRLRSATVAVGVNIPDVPTFVIAENKPNVLFVLDNSNSMDESASGAAVGSFSPESKSEIARGVLETMLTTYRDRMSVGLMTYKQNDPSSWSLHNSAYDASYDPANYNKDFTGDRASTTKKYRMKNTSSPGDYIYYNVALPYYANSNQGDLFCYSATSTFPSGTNGPYDCYNTKTGTSDGAPPGSGYANKQFTANFSPTDSDFAQGISTFGRRLTSNYVGPTWYRNESPGRGYLQAPIKPLDATQAAALLDKLACNVPGNPSPCTTSGIKNAGLTPIEGTLLTAKDYFGGSWTNASEGYTSSAYPIPVTCAKNFVILLTDGLPSTDKDGNTVSNPTLALQQAASAAASLKAAGVVTYVVGFALPYGTDPNSLNDIAVSGGTSRAYMASDQASLNDALDAIFSSIDADGSSSGSTVANSTSLDDSTRIYQASFNPADWTGNILAFEYSSEALDVNASWSASVPAVASRKIYTYNGTSRVDFTWANLSAAQQAIFGSQQVVDYLRGDRSNEGSGASQFRPRNSLLGDIVYSSPSYLHEEAAGSLPVVDLLMVGANDGMFHAFTGTGTTGVERFAYVPRGVDFANMKTLANKSYPKAHKYLVDGPVIASRREDTNNRNIVVGTLGRGGRGAFALDVTNPAAPTVLWDLTGSYAPNGMGKVLGAPFFGKYNDGGTIVDAVFIPNGITAPGATYTGFDKASLFVMNAVTGAVLRQLTAYDSSDPDTVSNGLSAPGGWDEDGDGVVDVLYGGDLRGNVWRWDLSSNSAQGTIMFRAQRGTLRQPISGGVSISQDSVNFNRWVFFGTGQSLTSADFTNRDVQSMYGVRDDGGNTMLGRADLKSRSITGEVTVGIYTIRVLEQYASQDLTKKGWYIDLLDPTNGAEGERVTGMPQDVAGRLTISTGIPGVNTCSPEGSGFIYFFDAYSGTSTQSQSFDTNGDGVIDDSDLSSGSVTSGRSKGIGQYGDGTMVGDHVVAGGTHGGTTSTESLDDTLAKSKIAAGRLSWRELIRD